MSLFLRVLLGLLWLSPLLNAQRTSPEPDFGYFRPPDFERPMVSPEGKFVGFIARADLNARLYRLDLSTGKIDGIFDPGQGEILSYWWITETEVLICGYGDRGLTYFVQDLRARKTRPITVLNKIWPSSIRPIPGNRTQVTIVARLREQYLATVDLNTGREKRIGSFIGGEDNAVTSASGELRSQSWMQGDTWRVQWRASARHEWKEIKGTKSLPTFLPIAMDADDRHLLVMAYDQGDTTALMRLDPASGNRTIVAQKTGRDARWTISAPDEGTPQATLFFDLGQEDLAFFDAELGSFHQKLRNSLPEKNCRIISRSADGKIVVISNWAPGHPETYYLFANGRLSVLGQERARPQGIEFGKFEAFAFTARDGFQGRGFIVSPPSASGPVPVVVLTPGFMGESIESGTRYNPSVQYLTSKGYAVAYVATRSQSGFGRKYEAVQESEEWSALVLKDLEDGIAYLAEQKRIDPARVALMGFGNRALIALRAATARPLYRAVIVHNPVTDLEATYGYWFGSDLRPQLNLVQQALGTTASWQMMRQFDPAGTLGTLQAPLLLICDGAHGKEFNYLVRRAASIRRQLEKHNHPHAWHVAEVPDEWRSDEIYLFELNRRIVAFLDQYMKATP